MPSVILYGGTFDPPHTGHRLVVERAAQLFPGSRVWISVAPAPAGASQQHKHTAASYEQRLAMCRCNFAEAIASGLAELTLIEAQLPAPNYTIRTLQACKQAFPDQRFALLIGLDQLEQFAEWNDPVGILQVCDLIVVSRGADPSLLDAVRALGRKLNLAVQDCDATKMQWQATGTFIYLLPGSVSDAASRHIRTDPNLALKKGWLVPEVAEFIQQHRIYTK